MRFSSIAIALIALSGAITSAAAPLQLRANTEDTLLAVWGETLSLHQPLFLSANAQDLSEGNTRNALSFQMRGLPLDAQPTLTVWSGDEDASIWEWSPYAVPQGDRYVISFAEFVPVLGWGADFEAITRIDFDPGTSGGKSGDTIRAELKLAATLNATKTDLLLDNDLDGEVNPGDMIEYTVRITNNGNENAMSVIFSDSPDTNTTLVNGSVSTTAGSILSGNGAGEANVQISIPTVGVAPCEPQIVFIMFRVTVDNPFPGGESEVCNQGTLTSANAPFNQTDDPDVPGLLNPTCSTVVTNVDPVDAIHTSDQDGDNQISLSELLRVIQFFNSGGFSCDLTLTSEDGYLPGAGDETCDVYDADYNPQDWQITLSELLRIIQFFNSGGYYACPGEDPPTEDGYCPGPQP